MENEKTIEFEKAINPDDIPAMSKEELIYLRIRNICGLLGIILPWIALFSAGIKCCHPSDEWWYSISATYYQSPALVGVLTPASIVLMCYIGYESIDNWITTLSGLFGLGIVLFPCAVGWKKPDDLVGFFQLPMFISNIIHSTCACVFFLLLAYNSFCLFTRKKEGEIISEKKQLRNYIYKTCGIGMLVFEFVFALCVLLDAPGYSTMIVEIILLHLFGISWLVKGKAIPYLNDEEDNIAIRKSKEEDNAK